MKYRKLRIAWSVGCGIACILLIAMWVRTTYFCETIFGPVASSSSLVMTSRQGGLGIGLTKSGTPSWSYSANQPDVVPKRTYVTLLGFAYSNPAGEGIFLRVHYPILIVGVTLLSILSWIHWTARFSLRTLLIAMTLFATALGLTVWATR
jgi:hypothetical protein